MALWARFSATLKYLQISISSRRGRRWLARIAAVAALLPPVVLIIAATCLSLPPELVSRAPEQSIRIEDRQGRLLREVRSSTGALSKWVPLSTLPAMLPKALIAIEDRRFFSHRGVDPLAVLRATAQALRHRRVVSGASTLTMQLARTLRPHKRNFWGKCGEMALALRIEASVSKDRILEEYLNRIDFGPNLRGVAAAAQGYFGRPVSTLSLGEIALLVGLPQGPTVYALGRHPERALARRNRVLDQLSESKAASREAIAAARAELLHIERRRPAFGAPHFVSALVQGSLSEFQWGLDGTETRGASRIRTTLDPLLQRATETALSSIVSELRGHQVTAGAALLIENATGDVLAYVGSPDFYDNERQGQVDGVLARRQPGSTLKPFVYAAAFEELGYTAATVIPDLELHLTTELGDYSPRNFDDKFRGPVRLREALGNSLNVPAVHTTAQLGSPTLLRYLHDFGFDSLKERPEYYGPALALGDGEVRLIELTRAYATLARGGLALPLRVVSEMDITRLGPGGATAHTRRFESEMDRRVISAATSAVITDILKDKTARAASFGLQSSLQFGFEVAAKTGTSKGFRDNWVVGYSHQFTVGVWVGNFDGSPMRQVGGITGAAPIFHAILDAAMAATIDVGLPLFNGENDTKKPNNPLGLQRLEICPISGQARGPDCPHGIMEYVPSRASLPTCQWHQTLAVDRRNGLLAGPNCPSGSLVKMKFEVFPPAYLAWAKSAGHALAPDQYSPNCPFDAAGLAAQDQAKLQIVEPKQGAQFVIDPDRDPALQLLEVTVAAPPRTTEVILEVDGNRTATALRPFVLNWRLSPGHHRMAAFGPDGKRSDPVEIDVRASGGNR
jgi:penicillin-binding protein 1C